MKSLCPALAFALLLGGCAASDDNKSNSPELPPAEAVAEPASEVEGEANTEPVAVATTPARASIASVQLKQNCPDPKPQAESKAAPAAKPSKSFAPSMPAPKRERQAKSKRKGDRAWSPPCSQSTVQIAFAAQAGAAAQVSLQGLRLLGADGKTLATLESRMPTIWQAGTYQIWDGVLAPGADYKTSYKISVPDWNAVETKLGGSSYGQMYTVEIDVEIDGQVTTLKSPQVERGRPQIIKT